jgi:hypothetical protein
MNTGMPVVAGAPDSAVATEIVGGIVEFLPTEMQEATRASLADRRPQPWYRKLLSRRADAPAT